ncbi:MAG: glycosyltransferase family 39 protein [Victivallaceae bacterium]
MWNSTDFCRKTFFLLLAATLVRLILMASSPLTDQSEGRYGSIAGNMAATGNFLDPNFWHEGEYVCFDGKPPLMFWMSALCVKVLGANAFAARLASFAAAAVLLGLLYYVIKRYRDRETAVFSVMFCGLSGFFFIFSGVCLTDMVLCMNIGGALLCYMAFLSEETCRGRKRWSMLLFIFLGLGFLTKGPVALALWGAPVFFWTLLNRKWATLKDHAWVTGPILFLAIAAPWFVLRSRENPDFLYYFFVNENFKRFLFKEYGDRFGSGREFHYFAAVWMFLVDNLPWSAIVILGCFKREFREKILDWRHTVADPVAGLSLLAVLLITGFWSLTSRVPITYLLPTIPVFAIWSAVLVRRCFPGENALAKARKYLWGLGVATLAGVGAGLVVMSVMTYYQPIATLYVIDAARELRETRPELAGKKFYFVDETPYSADFYGRNDIINHENETPVESINRAPEAILIFNERDRRRLGDNFGKLQVHRRVGAWYIATRSSGR